MRINEKILLKWIAVVLFVINAFVLVESAMSLGAVIDSLIAGILNYLR